jgi:glycosyltransferase involved in cell wall biosynthesis
VTLRVLILSRYDNLGASSRLRSYQYLPYLQSQGFSLTVSPLLGDAYIRSLYGHGERFTARDIASAYRKRLHWMRRATSFDAVWVEKEMLPWLPGWLELGVFPSGVPLVVDYDDAVFHRYDQHSFTLVRALLGKKIDTVMRRADLVVVGNDYLAERARLAGARRVEVLPTVVDVQHYRVSAATPRSPITIGWMGSPVTARYLHQLPQVYHDLRNSPVRWIAVGANPAQLKGLPFTTEPWKEESEVDSICDFDIGIMPLADLPFERGKCGYKLIQYMACGKPVIASPVGVNGQIVRHGIDGFLASSEAEWTVALARLIQDDALRQEMGLAARRRVEEHYALQVMAPRLEQLLRSFETELV